MAKGGSLLGKADTTLTGMSYKQAMADVTPDLGQVYKDEVLTQALFEKGVKDHFDTLYADNNALADELKEATKKAMTGLGTDYEAMELFNSHLTSMKDRMKALPKGKKGDFERAKIRAELAQLQKSSADLNDTETKLGTMISAGDFNEHATGRKNMSLYKSIVDGTAKKEIIDGNLVYSIDFEGENIKMDRQALNDALVQKDPEFQSNFNKIYAGENARGKQKGTTFDRQGAINDYEASFPSPAAFAANIHEKQGSLKYSFADALKYNKDGSDSIYKALMELDPATVKQYDANKDGKITNVDFANKENGIALIESLTNIHSDNFNYQAAKKAAAEFYADNISEKEFNDGVAMRPRDPNAKTIETKTEEYGGFTYATNESGGDPNHPDENKKSSYQNIGYVKQMQNRNTLLNFDPDDPSTSKIPGLHYDYQYDKEKGWQAFYNNEFVKNVKGSDIARIEGLLSATDMKAGKGTAMFNLNRVLKDKQTAAEQERLAPTIPGTVGLGALEVKGKTANAQHKEIRDNLFKIFNDQFKEEFDILPIQTYGTTGGGFGGSTTSVARDKIRIKSKDGSFNKEYAVGNKATQEIADQINEDLGDYITPIPSDLIIKN